MLLVAMSPIFSQLESAGSQPASIVIHNAHVWTADGNRPRAEAVALRDDHIQAVGTWDEIRRHVDSTTRVLDANGGMVVPGWIDSHVHLLDGGLNLTSVQLRDANSRREFARRVADFAKEQPAGTWITGGDWDHTIWGGELPTRGWIDEISPNHPVWLQRLDGHMALANSAALREAKVGEDVADVDGGAIVRDANGRLTGILKDNAMQLVARAVPPPSQREQLAALDSAIRFVNSHGVTSVHHMGSWNDLKLFRIAQKLGKLRCLRIYAMVPLDTWRELRDDVEINGHGDVWLRTGGLKGFVDGSLGSRTAAFLNPYSTSPQDHGLLVNTRADLLNWTIEADRAGLQVMVHAIGDRAIRQQLDIFREVAQSNGPRDRRFRIEHAQHISRPDISRFADEAVIASMQPYHAIDDGRWAEDVIGPQRIQTTYAFRELLDSGAKLAFGSDWFVAPPTPIEGIYAAVTRRTLDGNHPTGWVPQQKIRVNEALRAYTIDAAYAAFEEQIKGSIKPGKLADLVIIDRDLAEMPPEEIRQAHVQFTIVGGKIVFERPSSE